LTVDGQPWDQNIDWANTGDYLNSGNFVF